MGDDFQVQIEKGKLINHRVFTFSTKLIIYRERQRHVPKCKTHVEALFSLFCSVVVFHVNVTNVQRASKQGSKFSYVLE